MLALLCATFSLLGAARYNAVMLLPRNDVSRLAPAAVTLTGAILTDVKTSRTVQLVPDSADEAVRGSCLFAVRDVYIGSSSVHSGDRSLPVTGAVELRLPMMRNPRGQVAVPHVGDLLRVRGELDLPPGQRNPGGFDYRAWLGRRGVGAILNVRREKDWEFIGVTGDVVPRMLSAVRHGVLAHSCATLAPDRAAVLEGLLIGVRSDLPPELDTDFWRTGASHLLATAGLHVGIVVAMLIPLLVLARMSRRPALLFTIAAVILYAALTGGRPSVARAAFVAGIALMGIVLEREPDLPNAISMAALCLLLYEPRNLFDPGFQLSFATVITIVLLMPLVTGLLRRIGARRKFGVRDSIPIRWYHRGNQVIVASFCLTVAAQIGFAPLAAYYECEISPIAPLVNVLVVPVAPLLLACGFSGAALSAVSPLLSRPFDMAANGMLAYMIGVVRSCAALPWAGLSVVPPPVPLIVGYYAIVWGLALWLRRAKGLGRGKEKWQSDPLAPENREEANASATDFRSVIDSEERDAALVVSDQALTARAGSSRDRVAHAVSGYGALAILVVFLIGGHLALFGWSQFARRHDGILRVTFLDVGQGDAAVLETPGGKVIVVDTGGVVGDDDEGRRVVEPFLRYFGCNEIDALVLTHPHEDHIGGAPTLLRDFKVDMLLDNGQDSAEPGFLRVLEEARNRGVGHRAVRRGEEIDCLDGVTVKILAPTPLETQGAANNASVVLQVRFGRTGFLLTGDAEADEEADLLRNDELTACDVLKAGHHGSHTSTTPEFLAATHPHWVIISVGAHNLYGHPSPDVLTRLRDNRVATYRTDQNAAVTCLSDGITVQTQSLNPSGS